MKTNKYLSLIAATMLVGVAGCLPARAACTLDPNPLLNLSGTWAFQTSGVVSAQLLQKIVKSEIRSGGFAALTLGGGTIAGTFTASPEGGRRGGSGLLSILASANLSGGGTGGVYGLSQYEGTFQMDGNCDHGILNFASAAPNLASPYEFYFTNLAKTEIFLIGMQSDVVFYGTAKKIQ